jgi:hypothetical protein
MRIDNQITKPETKTVTMTAQQKADKDPDAMLKRGLEIQANMEAEKKELEEIKKFFLGLLPKLKTSAEYNSKYGSAKLTIANSYSVNPAKMPILQRIFGTMLEAFVVEKKDFGITAAFKKILSSGDHKKISDLRDAVVIKQTESVKLTPLSK